MTRINDTYLYLPVFNHNVMMISIPRTGYKPAATEILSSHRYKSTSNLDPVQNR